MTLRTYVHTNAISFWLSAMSHVVAAKDKEIKYKFKFSLFLAYTM